MVSDYDSAVAKFAIDRHNFLFFLQPCQNFMSTPLNGRVDLSLSGSAILKKKENMLKIL